LKREAIKLQEHIAFLEQSEGKIVQYADAMRAAIREAGFEVAEVIKHLQVPKIRAPRGSKPKTKSEREDSTGTRPERGTTYKHLSWPEPWIATGKRAPKYVVASIRSGKTWKQLVAK
jgi:hypothetical protein